MEWIVLRNKWASVKGHVLILNRYSDVRFAEMCALDKIEFVVFADDVVRHNFSPIYKMDTITSLDSVTDFRNQLKNKYQISYLGHLFTTYESPATYKFLEEWLLLNVNEVNHLNSTQMFSPPHVIVFDMDSTLITEEEEVRLRDPFIHESLDFLKRNNCVLCLWSYGERRHVVESLKKLNLYDYFLVVLSEGRKLGDYHFEDGLDTRYEIVYKSTPFYLNVQPHNLPKSPRVILHYLKEKGINFIKTITLVDDLHHNNIHYDNFVNLTRCPEPVQDWHVWHSEIVRYLKEYDCFHGDS
ncbi:ORF77 [Agrotis segetum granulovirus]|uniref:38k n=1 Tax=Agrotis segetum granulosis virus TaxID=10464 RepID=Q6QXN8_GVAS|nr:38k [Agrotis segetum granulovirus]AAS82661.1 ORF77 [Agrotis segetum granulovirus]AHN92129.1 38k protein [Agrotis segetum granulovirus]AKN63364.1 38k [Agrotis segetum granulovirus]